jgi:hypothetical protein
MPRQLIAKCLDRESADQAFALARNAAFGLSLEDWHRFLDERAAGASGEGGVLAIQNRLGIIQGLCSYRFDPVLGRGKVCTAEIIVALDLVDTAPVATALLQALEDLARRKGAEALRLTLPQGSPTTDRLIARLTQRGHRVDAIGLVKDLRSEEAGS